MKYRVRVTFTGPGAGWEHGPLHEWFQWGFVHWGLQWIRDSREGEVVVYEH